MTASQDLFQQALELIPGGVNSPVRACLGVDSSPRFIDRAKGSRMWSVEGEEYIDYVLSWGPMILGHNHDSVMGEVAAALEKGTSFGAPCAPEVRLARLLVDALPGVDMVRMVNSGTEATMSALRLARGHTGRNRVVKFVGCYHGHSDAFLAQAGSGVATLAIPGTPGVPEATVADTLLAPYNSLEAVRELFGEHGQDIACVIVEPVAGNMGLVPPSGPFLEGLRDLCDEYGALLVFDEVITGFRVGYSGAQGRYNITPDLTCLGKIIGGGFPVGAYGGKREIMEQIAPCGGVYQAGTLAGNPVAMTAGAATLALLKEMDYQALEKRTASLAGQLKNLLRDKGLPVQLNHVGSIFTLFFAEEPVTDFASAAKADGRLYATFWHRMREAGVNLAPSGFECAFTSFAHSAEDFEQTLEAARSVNF